MSNQPSSSLFGRKIGPRFGVVLKTGAIAFLILLLHIPLLMVRGTLFERRQSRNEAVASISRSWGGSQELIGPLLVVPGVWTRTVDTNVLVEGVVVQREKTVEQRVARFSFPKRLRSTVTLKHPPSTEESTKPWFIEPRLQSAVPSIRARIS